MLSEEDLEICEEIRSDDGIADKDPNAQCQKKQHKLKKIKNIQLNNFTKLQKNNKSEDALSPEALGKIEDCFVRVLVGLFCFYV